MGRRFDRKDSAGTMKVVNLIGGEIFGKIDNSIIEFSSEEISIMFCETEILLRRLISPKIYCDSIGQR